MPEFKALVSRWTTSEEQNKRLPLDILIFRLNANKHIVKNISLKQEET